MMVPAPRKSADRKPRKAPELLFRDRPDPNSPNSEAESEYRRGYTEAIDAACVLMQSEVNAEGGNVDRLRQSLETELQTSHRRRQENRRKANRAICDGADPAEHEPLAAYCRGRNHGFQRSVEIVHGGYGRHARAASLSDSEDDLWRYLELCEEWYRYGRDGIDWPPEDMLHQMIYGPKAVNQ